VDCGTGSFSETRVTGDVGETEEDSIKVEEAIDIKDEMPESVKCPPIKIENEVRLYGVCEVVVALVFRLFIAAEGIVKLHLIPSYFMLYCGCNIALKFGLHT
jgi:hypothetical protein